ncbi:MAG TPA: oligosaccharide flippase family protein, partial [Pirellulaceae bacterium]|nr:oligosaccharide flippase family protein [Pirellulaceae bacterium]
MLPIADTAANRKDARLPRALAWCAAHVQASRGALVQTALSFALRLLGAGLTFIAQGLLARWLGAQSFGEVMLLLAWLNMAVLVAKCGFDLTSLRWVAALEEQRDWNSLQRFRSARTLVTALASGAVIALGCAVIAVLGHDWPSTLQRGALVLLLIVPAAAWLEHWAAELRARHAIVQTECVLWLVRPAIWLVGCFALQLGAAHVNPLNVMLCYAVATIAALALAAHWNRLRPGKDVASDAPAINEKWIRGSLLAALATFGALALAQTDALLLGALRDAEAAGVYSLASRLAALVSLGLTAINGVGAVQLARLWAQADAVAFRRGILRITAWSALYAVPAALACWLLADEIFSLFGPEFAAARAPLGWLLCGQIVNACCGPVAYVALVTGRERLLAHAKQVSTGECTRSGARGVSGWPEVA